MGIRHIPAIDGLRAIAVLSVVAYHAGAPAGFVGVDVFFVISGYLITRILLERPPLVEFYARRARRILPAAFLVVLVTLGLSFLLFPGAGDVARSAAAAGLFVANLFFQSATGGYWDASAESMPLLHLWSLSVEEQFYLAWPLLILFAKRWVGFVFAASLCLYAFLSWANPEAAFYQTYARAWELAAGGLVAMWSDRHSSLSTTSDMTRSPLAIQPMSACLSASRVASSAPAIAYSPGYFSSGPHCHITPNRPSKPCNCSHAGRIGWPSQVLRILTRALTTENRSNSTTDSFANAATDVPLRSGAASTDAIKDRRSIFSPRARLQVPPILRNIAHAVLQHASRFGLPLVLLACLVPLPVYVAQPLAVLGATLVVASVHAGRASVLSARPLVYVGLISYSLYLWHWPLLALDRATRVGESPIGTRLALVTAAFVLAALSYRYVEQPFRRMRVRPARAVAIGVVCAAALATTAFSLAEPPKAKPVVVTASHLRCHPWGPGVTPQMQPGECVPDAPKIVLWGDSYTGAWLPYVLREANGRAVVGMVETDCPVVLGVDLPRATPRVSAYCKTQHAKHFAYLQTHPVDTLLVSAHWARMLRERPDAGPGVIAWAKGLPKVRRIIVIGATPELRDSVEKCQAMGVSCEIPRPDYERSAQATKAVMRELNKLPNVEVWDVGDWMCDAERCHGVRDGVALYQHDAHHISQAAADAFVRESRTSGTRPLSSRSSP